MFAYQFGNRSTHSVNRKTRFVYFRCAQHSQAAFYIGFGISWIYDRSSGTAGEIMNYRKWRQPQWLNRAVEFDARIYHFPPVMHRTNPISPQLWNSSRKINHEIIDNDSLRFHLPTEPLQWFCSAVLGKLFRTFSLRYSSTLLSPSVRVTDFGWQHLPMTRPLRPVPAPSSNTCLPRTAHSLLNDHSQSASAASHTLSPVVPCDILLWFSFSVIISLLRLVLMR